MIKKYIGDKQFYKHTLMVAVPIYIIVCCTDFIKCAIGFVLLKKGVWLQNIVKDI